MLCCGGAQYPMQLPAWTPPAVSCCVAAMLVLCDISTCATAHVVVQVATRLPWTTF